MNEGLNAFYEGLRYEDGFGPFEVRPSMQRKKLIDTLAIVEATKSLKREMIFGKCRESSPYCLPF